MEQMPSSDKISPDGKKYEYEKDGVYYGGEYLPEPPKEIDPNLPAPPPVTEHPAI